MSSTEVPRSGPVRSAEPLADPQRLRMQLDGKLRSAIQDLFGVDIGAAPAPLDGGEECAVWRVGEHVLRISPAWRTEGEVRWTHDLARHVARAVPEAVAPMEGRGGLTFLRHNGCPVALYPYVDGAVAGDRTAQLASSAGELLARVHAAIATRVAATPSPATVSPYERIPPPDDLVDRELDAWHSSLMRTGARRAAIHGDVYRRNILVRDGRIVALLDWDEAHDDFVGQEIGWTMWEFAKIEDVRLDPALARAFLDGYTRAGGVLDAGFDDDAIRFIRWRLREEIRSQLAGRARGEPVDEEYLRDEITAFHHLR
jgi:hypothetical protein